MEEALSHLKCCDPVLGRLIEAVGPYAIEFIEPDFEALVRAIVLQQLSGKVAAIIFGRLRAAAGNGRVTPEGVLKLRPSKMRALGLSQRKIEYIRGLAREARSGELDFAAFASMPDQAIEERLTSIKGIGAWTVHMFLIFALRRHDVLPTGDLGIRAAVRKVYGLVELPTPAEVNEMGRKWRPWCTVASWYLWRSLEDKAGL
jgi:DNA-3-methyladenine glycosylase II